MTPPVLSPAVKSAAERRVFQLLAQTKLPDAVCYHSVNLSEHDYKIVSELDFVILSPRGLLVLEVKGGGVARRDGVWTFTDRYGRTHARLEGPFQQARSGMYSLRDRLANELTRPLIDTLPIGYGVIFPDCDFRERSVEWADEMVLDGDAIRGAPDLKRFVDQLYAYWSEKQAHRTVPSAHLLERVGQLLRADFEKIPSLRLRADQLDAEMERLTRAQCNVLDAVERAPRILCDGGAGTGKTFLAAETARRHAAGGERVCLACANPVLAAFLGSRLAGSGVDVRVAPSGLPMDQSYDVLVVDEGQDLLTMPSLERLDAALRGGLSDGRWRFFHDVNRQSGLESNVDPEALELLSQCGAVPMSLQQNCRNTRQIVLQTRLITAADLGTPTAGDGPPVHVDQYRSQAEGAALIDGFLKLLADRNVPSGEITILSARPLEESCVLLSRAYSRGRVVTLDEEVARAWPCTSTTLARVADFKGLENRFIIVVDLLGIDRDTVDTSTMYVAMSRARAGLWIALDATLMDSYNAVQLRNFPLVREDANEIAKMRTQA